ncbi:MAG: DUF3883 domain-containing protein [Gammaproteobacteria bacterium]|nr:DUF3883 domain-containing protein [Gammaproteobacteria bacterium]
MEDKSAQEGNNQGKTKEQRHIEKILAGYTYNGFSNLSANVLERDITTGFTGGNKFVYELLQNADDSSEDEKKIHVQFQLIKIDNQQYLLFSHDGKHFSRKNVKKIASYADQDQSQDSDEEDTAQAEVEKEEISKSKDSKKIGFKGVGFKAVFTFATYVVIFSRGYRFRFDSNSREHAKWPGNKLYPWQVMPIWTEAEFLPEELRSVMLNDQVNFLFKIAPGIDITESLNFIKDNTQMLLFLRNVHKVTIARQSILGGKTADVNSEYIVLTKSQNGIHDIKHSSDASKNSTWLIKTWAQKIESALKEELKMMSVQACPDRLKNADDIELTFAARVNQGKLVTINNARIYCYLPTQVLSGLPFLVNADFLLDPPRAIVIDNKWNMFLVKLIARYQFIWISELSASEEFRLQVLNVMGTSELKFSSEICINEFKAAYINASMSIAFIPGKRPRSVLLPSQALIDETKFYDEFPELNPGVAGKELIESKLGSQQKLKFFNVEVIQYKTLLPLLSQHCKESNSIDLHFRIISFIYKNQKEFDQSQLRKAEFLLTHTNGVSTPELTYFKREEGCDQYPGIGQLCFIHPELLVKLNRQMVSWLSTLDVQEATPIKLFKKHVLKLVENNGITAKDIIAYTRFIFGLFCENLLTSSDFEKLKKLKVLTQTRKLVEPWQCYLPDCFSPVIKLEDLVLDANVFVNESYYDSAKINVNDNNICERWGKFFAKICVNCDIIFVQEDVKVTEIGSRVWKFNLYLRHLQSSGQATTQVHSNQTIQNLVYSPMMFLVEHKAALPIFLERTIQHWHIINNGRSMSYQMSKTCYDITYPYIQFIFTTHNCLLGEDGIPRPANKLFSKEFKTLAQFDNAIIVVSDEVKLNDDLLRHFGVIYELNFRQCLTLLTSLEKSLDIEISCLSVIWRQLLLLEKRLQPYEVNQLKLLNIRFPTQKNELKSKAEIKCFSVKGRSAPFSVCWLKHYPGFSDEEMEAVAMLFGISIFSENKHELYFGKNKPIREDETHALFFKPLSQVSQWTIMGILVYLEGRHRGDKKFGPLWTSIAEAFMKLDFYKVESIICKYTDQNETDESLQIHLENRKFYYKRQWRHYKRVAEFCKVLGTYLGLSNDTIQKSQELLLIPFDKLQKKVLKMMLPVAPPFEQPIPVIQADDSYSAPKKLDDSSHHPEDDIAASDEDSRSHDEEFVQEGSPSQESFEINTPPSTISSKDTPPGTPLSSQDSKQKKKVKQGGQDKTPSVKLVSPAGFDFSKLRKIPDAEFTVKKKSPAPAKVSLTLLKDEVLQAQGHNSSTEPASASTEPNPLQESGSFGAASPQQSPRLFSGSEKPQLTSHDKNRIGRCGEELIYLGLRDKYLSKYPGCKIDDGKNGFEITAARGADTIKITVIWHNKDEKRDEDRDITIIKPPNKHDDPSLLEQSVHRYIEVKATTTSKKSFHWTAREIALARAEGNRYKLIHIKNIDTDDPVFAKIRNPIDKLDKELVIEGYKIGF